MLKDVNSDTTPIVTKGIDILLPDETIAIDVEIEPAQKKQKVCAFATIMGKNDMHVQYLEYVQDIDKKAHIDEQILHYLYDYIQGIGLGYRDQKQRSQLSANVQKIKNTLCCVQKYWKVLLRAEFPSIPDNEFSSSKFITSLQEMNRTGSK